jgi:hypothetical protein
MQDTTFDSSSTTFAGNVPNIMIKRSALPFIFERSHIQISAQINYPGDFCGYTQSLQANARTTL